MAFLSTLMDPNSRIRQEAAFNQQVQSGAPLTPEQRQAMTDFMVQSGRGFFGRIFNTPERFASLSDADLTGQYMARYQASRDRSGDALRDFVLPMAAGALVGLGVSATLTAPAATGAGAPISSTAATTGATASTPALTTMAGPTGTNLLSTTVPTASLGGAGAVTGGAASSELLADASRTAAPTSATSSLTTSDALLAASAVPQVMSLFAGAPEMPDGSGAAAQDLRSSTASRERNMETRRQLAGRAAAAAGVTRSGNEADLLGHVGRTTERRRAGMQRVVLGY